MLPTVISLMLARNIYFFKLTEAGAANTTARQREKRIIHLIFAVSPKKRYVSNLLAPNI